MKKSRIKTIGFTLVLLGIAALPLMAQTTGTLTLTGTVPPILRITVTALPAASALDLSSDTDTAVATVVERSNKKGGYTVSVESLNAITDGTAQPFFKSIDAANGDTLAYNLTYGGTTITFTGGSAIVTDSNTRTTGAGESREVRVSYTGAFLYEDTYNDTLTFTITAK
jgi:hypothetical protein